MNHKTPRTILVACAALAGATTHAAILSVSGSGVLEGDLTQVGYTANYFNDPTTAAPIHFWNEKQNVELTAALLVDIDAQGTYQNPFTSANATIASGTRISSHYAYHDPVGSATAIATVRFDAPILGIIILSGTNNATDKLLRSDHLIPMGPTSVPASHFNARGLEMGPEIVTWLSPNEVTLKLVSSNPGDQVRIVTAVPEPGTLLAAAIGIGGLLSRRMRRRNA